VAVRFAIAKENGTVFDFQDARVGEGDFEDVRGKVFQACFAAPHGLGVHVPVELPDLRRDFIEEARFLHGIAELGFEDHGESSDGEIEVDPGRVPEAIGGGEGAAGDDVMDMGVILEGSAPGVEDTEESGEITADVFFIQGEFFDGLGGGLEQGRVSDPLVFANEAAQFFRDRKGKQEVMTGKLPLDLFFQPLSGLMVLTSGAMAISTGAIDPMELATFFALVDCEAADFGVTADDGIDDFAVYFRHDLGVAFEVLGAKGSEDLIDCGHGPVPPSPD
jgi:hypothetical protein